MTTDQPLDTDQPLFLGTEGGADDPGQNVRFRNDNVFAEVPLAFKPDKDESLRRKDRSSRVVNDNEDANARRNGSNIFGQGPKKQKTLREKPGKSDLISGKQSKAKKNGTESQRNMAAKGSEYRPITNE